MKYHYFFQSEIQLESTTCQRLAYTRRELIAIRNQCVGLRLPQADVSLIKNLTLNSVTQTRRGVRGGYRSTKSKTSVSYFSAQSVRNKLLHINDHLSDKNFGIIGIVETWLMEKDHAIKNN